MFLQGTMAGLFIGLGVIAATTVSHSVHNASLVRLLSGAIIPFGLIMAMLTGGELFTGNCLMIIAVVKKRIPFRSMLRNLTILYLGNSTGAVLLAFGYVATGLLNYSDGSLIIFFVDQAIKKCSLSFTEALILSIFCNILVCTAVMISLSANDVSGRAIGAYVPISIFVISGFEHSIANLFLVPTGLLSLQTQHHAGLIASSNIHLSNLTWLKFFTSTCFR